MGENEEIGVGLYLFCLISQQPAEVYNPRKNFPKTLFAIIVINVLIFLFEIGLDKIELLKFLHAFGLTPSHFPSVESVYTLVTYSFLHSSWSHLLINMYILWIFGDNVNDLFFDFGEKLRSIKFFSFYLTIVVISGLTHLFLTINSPIMSDIVLVGASGGVSGMIASYWRLFPKSELFQVIFFYPFKIPVWIYAFLWLLINFSLAVNYGSSSSISWQAHLGGFVAGYFLIPYFLPFDIKELE